MTMKENASSAYLHGMAIGSALVAAYDALAYARNVEPTHPVSAAWPLIFLVLLALWVTEDSKAYPNVQKPFEYGFLVFVLNVLYLPYYLWRSRAAKGLLWLAGFVLLFQLSWVAQWAVYWLS